MFNVLGSATKLVFIMVALTVCIGFFMNKISNDQFVGIVGVVFAFYYRYNVTTSEKEDPTTPPGAGAIVTTTQTQTVVDPGATTTVQPKKKK